MLYFIALSALVVLPAWGLQEDPRVAELIRSLDADDFPSREKAQQELVELGEAALPALRKAAESASAEVKMRAAAAVEEIGRRLKVRTVYRDPKTITLAAKERPLEEVLEEIGRQADIKFEGSLPDLKTPVTLELAEAPLFLVLDRLGELLGKGTFAYNREGRIEFSGDPYVRYPVVYTGPVRVRVRKAELIRSDDFKAWKGVVRLTMDADFERYLRPFPNARIEIREARDNRGTKLEVREGFESDEAEQAVVRGGRIIIRAAAAVGGPGWSEPDNLREFSLRGLAAESSRLTILGDVGLTFPLRQEVVSLGNPQEGRPVERGGFRITAERSGRASSWKITWKRTVEGEYSDYADIKERLDPDSLVAVDGSGEERRGRFDFTHTHMHTFVMGGMMGRSMPDPGYSVQATFDGVKPEDVREVRFRFVDQTWTKKIPFELKDLPLP